jgi:protein-S-isoprenylcysteine O-methyltransferase Ste14
MSTIFIICIGFILIHSAMVSTTGKKALANLSSPRFMRCHYRLIFSIVSFILMFTAYYLIETIPDQMIFTAPVWFKIPMYLIQITGMLFGMGSLLILDAAEFFGIRQIQRCRQADSGDNKKLSIDGVQFKLATTGVYGIIRHPIYFAGIVMITFQPDVSYNWLIVTIMADAYFLYAAFKEERFLRKTISAAYLQYAKQVSMFNVFKGLYARVIKKQTVTINVSEELTMPN